MALGALGLIGAVLALVGAAFGANALIGIGVLLFFFGFAATSFAFASIPSYVWVFAIILFIWWLSKKK